MVAVIQGGSLYEQMRAGILLGSDRAQTRDKRKVQRQAARIWTCKNHPRANRWQVKNMMVVNMTHATEIHIMPHDESGHACMHAAYLAQCMMTSDAHLHMHAISTTADLYHTCHVAPAHCVLAHGAVCLVWTRTPEKSGRGQRMDAAEPACACVDE